MPAKTADIARLIDHSLLHPAMTDTELREGCILARENAVAAVSIKPYAVPLAVEVLAGSTVAVGAVVGFPHGNSHVEIKRREAELACREGAIELDMVVNIGKVLSEDWEYVRNEIYAVNQVAVTSGALLKVIFENDFLNDDHFKRRLCELCSEVSVAFVKTSTGYGFVKQPAGGYDYRGATEEDIRLMREHCPGSVRIKAAGKVRTLDEVLRMQQLGVSRVGASATADILAEARARGYGD